MNRRHQVFVSSTYSDLENERSEVMQALLELECFPAGMELFPAANETQWEWIKRVIDESDYYIVIVGGRYGTIYEPVGLSYTEMEYRYAIEQKIPTIGFLHANPEELPQKFSEVNLEKKKQLNAFRNLVMSKLCKFYDSPTDLGAKVSRSITQLKSQNPSPGWIRANLQQPTTDQFLELIQENQKLRSQIEELSGFSPSPSEPYADDDDELEIQYQFSRRKKDPQTKGFKKIGDEIQYLTVTWKKIFFLISECIEYKGTSIPILAGVLTKFIENSERTSIEEKYPGERIQEFLVEEAVTMKILYQFEILGVIKIGIDDTLGRGVVLTKMGKQRIQNIKAIRKGQKPKIEL